KVISYG
ncbi:two component regulator propeller family protein, partial [Vibrio harveyi]